MHKRIAALGATALAATAIATPAIGAQDHGAKKDKAPAAKAQTIKVQGSSLRRSFPVTGKGEDGTFAGRFKIASFAVQDGKLVAIGRLVGNVTSPSGQVSRFDKQVTMPAALAGGTAGAARAAQTSCRIVTLVLGPLDLNVLGLRVQLNQINLRITGERGSGNLLGNLLCALTGLLDQTGVPRP